MICAANSFFQTMNYCKSYISLYCKEKRFDYILELGLTFSLDF